jgi:2'-hydroxyisoflavone reductase
VRVADGGDVLAPAPAERPVQFVDVRDLGDWLVVLAENRTSGVFNAARPASPFGDLLEACREVSSNDARFVWVDEAFLLEHEVGQWMELPLWLAGDEVPFLQADVSRAVDAGLRFRPAADTVADTLEWARATGARRVTDGHRMGVAGMEPAREAELLTAWRERQS